MNELLRRRTGLLVGALFIAAGACALTRAGLLAAPASASGIADAEKAFLTDNQAAMSRMMSAMQVQPSGNVDLDFVAAMVPHHQGAIDMARAELQYGHDERLRRMAQEIIVEQTQEIAAMQLAARDIRP